MEENIRTIVVMLCRLGRQLCALPLTHVVETMRPLPIRVMPGRPVFMSGLSLVRGAPLPIVNGAVLIGEPATPPGRFVTLQVGARQIVLAVQEVVGIAALAADLLEHSPPILARIQVETVATITALDSEFLWLFDAARIVPAEVAQADELARATA